MAIVRHMAAAVLYAVVSIVGSSDFGSNSSSAYDTDGSSDDDAGVECVSYTPQPGRRESSLVLTAASRLCGEQIDGAWVVQDHHRPAAAAAVHQSPDHTAVIDLSAEAPMYHTTLLARALDRCRETGAIKVVVQSSVFDAPAVRATADSRGFRFSRTRHEPAGVAASEFYTDLYWSEPA